MKFTIISFKICSTVM